MIKRFSYTREEGTVKIVGDGGDVLELAIEVSYLCNKLYNILYRNNPALADGFRNFVLESMIRPDFPTWKIFEPNEGTVEAVITTPKKEG